MKESADFQQESQLVLTRAISVLLACIPLDLDVVGDERRLLS